MVDLNALPYYHVMFNKGFPFASLGVYFAECFCSKIHLFLLLLKYNLIDKPFQECYIININ